MVLPSFSRPKGIESKPYMSLGAITAVLMTTMLLLWTSSECVCSSAPHQLGRVPVAIARLSADAGTVSCKDVVDYSNNNWYDPNHGKLMVGSTTRVPKQVRVSVHTEEFDKVRYSLFTSGTYYEEGLRSWFEQVLKDQPASYTMDVGANIGYFSLVAAGLGHSVVSIEPNTMNLLRLCESVMLNQFDNRIAVYRAGVTDDTSNDEMILEWPPGKPGEARLRSRRDGETFDIAGTDEQNKVLTPLISLDEVAQQQGLFQKKVLVLKIDVEDFEQHVLQGGSKFLQSGAVENLFIEFWQHSGKKIVEILVEYGFVPNMDEHKTAKGTKEQIYEALVKEKETKPPPFNVWWVYKGM